MKKLAIVGMLALCGCASEKCIQNARAAWNAEVEKCIDEGKNSEQCGLDELTAKRAREERACVR